MAMTDDELMLTCAVRYALSRHSYVTGCARDWVRERWPTLSDSARVVIRRDLEEHVSDNSDSHMASAHSAIDMRVWMSLLDWIHGRGGVTE